MKDADLDKQRIPLAERLRPRTLDEVIGQTKLVGPGGILRQIVDKKEPVSLIFWSPPGTGKTTLARIIAKEMDADFVEISAVTAKKADVETVVERARQNWNLQIRTILFVDEIHRFNKAQQDAFLPHVESGLITLIGATTENPSFEVISPLISRSRVVVLEQLSVDEVKEIILRAAAFLFCHPKLDLGSSKRKLAKDNSKPDWIPDQVRNDIAKKITDDAIDTLAEIAHGDARIALGNLEIAAGLIKNRQKITPKIVEQAAGTKLPRYDKTGDGHYDTISAFIKSMRAGDDVAALYYMARMIAAGEDPKFIARRMVIFASEDVGLAGNGALGLALNAFMAIERVGMPEGGIILSHVVVALARAKKSRESNDMWGEAQKLAKQFPDAPVPIHVRNAPTKLMKDLGFGEGQKWVAGFKHEKGYLPEEVAEFLDNKSS
ncbi:replication-associated recombination protein A [Candidatus Saccharibacteria bacterium]|nr:replication-associated recombination protein A [Candidatus Saccharibacteria bacterium]